MILYHVTPRRNLNHIMQQGLRVPKARGKRRVIWLATADALVRMVAHVAAHQMVLPREMAVVAVLVYRSAIKRSGRPGVYWSADSIPANRLTLDCVSCEQ